jgi:hypothetical protein
VAPEVAVAPAAAAPVQVREGKPANTGPRGLHYYLGFVPVGLFVPVGFVPPGLLVPVESRFFL